MINDQRPVVFVEPPVKDKRHIPERFAGCSYMLYPLPDLANFYMLSYFKQHGIESDVVNAVIDELDEEAFYKAIDELNPRALILHSVVLAKPIDMRYIPSLVKRYQVPLLIHGPEPTRVPNEYVEAGGGHSDKVFVFRGEPEKNMAQFLLNNVKSGVTCFENNEIKTYPHTHEFLSIEDLPYDFHFHPTVKRLSKHFLNAKFPRPPVATMLASRGCPFPCSYCVPNSVSFSREMEYRDSQNGRKPRAVYASPNRVIKEFKAIKQAGYPSVMVMDDQFLASKKRTLEICEGIAELNLDWGCLSRPDFLDDEEVVHALAKAGCISVDIGIETLSQRLLDLIDKRLDLNTFYKAIPLLQKYKIEPKINIMFGSSVEETEQDIYHTIDELKRLKVHHVMFAVATPFKGTPFYNQARESGILINDQDDINPLGKSMISYPHLDHHRLQELCQYAYRSFYLRPSQLWHRVKSYRSFSTFTNDVRVFANLFLRDQSRRLAQ